MLATVLSVVAAIVSAATVGWVSRRILGTPVGWPRSIVVGLLVFATGLPIALWVATETGIVTEDRGTVQSTTSVAVIVILLAMAWVFALGVAVLVGLEAIWPTRSLPNPLTAIRAALDRRRRTRRYLQILTIASRHGAGWIFHGRAQRKGSTAEQRAGAVVATINASGVSFVKLGQVLSTRRDLVPEPYLSALGSLQSGATTLPWPTIRAVIEEELGRPIDEVFTAIQEQPLAAASVAQVHTGTLLDGSTVVVKVQRPTAREQVEADVDIILRLARRAEQHTSQGRDLRAESVARGFTTTLLDELDYGIELSNTEMIRSTLADIAEHNAQALPIAVPRTHRQASSKRMLTMDLVDGTPLSKAATVLEAMPAAERERIAAGLMNTVIEQILVYGVFHADLHPGNVILKDDRSLGLIDFGAIGIIERSQREHLAALLLAASAEDDIAATDALLLIVDVPDDADVDAFRHDIGIVLTSVRHRPAGDGSIFTLMLDVIRSHHIALPATLASAFRSFATLEGCLRVLDPDFDMVGRALDHMPALMKRMLSIKRLAVSAQAQAAVAAAFARKLPRRLEALTSQLERGTLSVRVRSFAGEGERSFVSALVAQIVGALVSITAVVLAIVLVVSGSGPQLAPHLTLFELLGGVVGFVGFLGILRAVRHVLLEAPRS